MMKKQAIAVGISVLSTLLPYKAIAASLDFSKLYVFGDSLSDTGNIFTATSAAQQLPIPGIVAVPPSPPYFAGRFTNGPNWVDLIAQNLGLTLTPSTQVSILAPDEPIQSPITIDPTTGSPQISLFFGGATATQSINFAFGGAQTGEFGAAGDLNADNTVGRLIPGLKRQVNAFVSDLAVANQPADGDALYIVLAGANDYQSVLDADPVLSVQNIVNAVDSLFQAGARNFLIPNLPNLGLTPSALSVPGETTRRQTLSLQHNTLLADSLKTLQQSKPGIDVRSLDIFSYFNEAVLDPASVGLTNVTQPCLLSITVQCSNPNEYLFWDGVHPTATAHAAVANRALAVLESEPEPETVPEPGAITALSIVGGLWLKRFNRRQPKSAA